MKSSGHFSLAIATTSTPQSLASAFVGGTTTPQSNTPATAPIHFLSIQPGGANAGIVYVGFAGDILSSTNYAFRLEVPVSTIPQAPFIIEGPITSLAQVQIMGTEADTVKVGYIRG